MCWGKLERVTLFVNAYEVIYWDWEDHLDRMNKEVDKDNERGGNLTELTILEASAVFKKKFCKKIGFLLSAPTFGLGGRYCGRSIQI